MTYIGKCLIAKFIKACKQMLVQILLYKACASIKICHTHCQNSENVTPATSIIKYVTLRVKCLCTTAVTQQNSCEKNTVNTLTLLL